VDYERSEADKRSVRVSLSAKGRQAAEVVARLYQRQLGSVEAVAQVTSGELHGLNKALGRLERFWTDQIRFRL
ncbi:MAG: MarR family transcriptional regulator, partial [Hyphomicrobium sp.]